MGNIIFSSVFKRFSDTNNEEINHETNYEQSMNDADGDALIQMLDISSSNNIPLLPEASKTFDSLESEIDEVKNYLIEVGESNNDIADVVLKWFGNAKSVSVTGDFSNWLPLTMSQYEKNLWKIKLKLKHGNHLLKFQVDGKNICTEYLETVIGEDEESYNKLNVNVEELTIHEKQIEFAHTREATNVTYEATNDIIEEVTDAVICWKGVASNVMVSGEFSNWSGISMTKSHVEEDLWSVKLKLKYGEYLMFFFVDGQIVLSDDYKQIECTDDDETYNIFKLESEKEIICKNLHEVDKANCIDEVNDTCENIEIPDNQVHGNTANDNFHTDSLNDCSLETADASLTNQTVDESSDDSEDDAEHDCEVKITWIGFADDVRVVGEFSNGVPITLSNQGKGSDLWTVNLKVQEGPHLLQFIVDKKFTLSETMEKVIGPNQEVYNIIVVGSGKNQEYEIR